VIALVAALAVAVALLATALVYATYGRRLIRPKPRTRRILVPFTGGQLDPMVLGAALRIAQAEESTLVPAYLLVVPLEYSEDSVPSGAVGIAMPLLEAVEHAALRAGIPVDARIETGRTPTHALSRLWEVESFDRVIAPAPVANGGGFTPKDLTWILAHAPGETLVLKPGS